MSKKPVDKKTEQTFFLKMSAGNNPYDKGTVVSSHIQSFPATLASNDARSKKYPHNCHHWKSTQSFTGATYPDGSWEFINHPTTYDLCGLAVERARSLAIELRTVDASYDFSGIEFIKELPKSFGLFDPKSYAKYSGYGQYTWGFVPFVSDVKGLLKSLESYYMSLKHGSFSRPFNKSRDIKVEIPCSIGQRRLVFTGVAKFNGIINVKTDNIDNTLAQIKYFLDTFNINPDVLTLWELTPFSFVVDYFIPVSKFLETLVPRGFQSYTYDFDGIWSLKGSCDAYIYPQYGTDIAYAKNKLFGSISYYERLYTVTSITFSPGVKSKNQFKILEPSNKNLFDTLYVASQQFRKK